MLRLLIFTFVFLAGCGGGGGGGGTASLQGTWFGTIEDTNADLFSFEVTIDGSNQLISVRIDGVDVIAGVGPIALVQESAFTWFAETGDVMFMFDSSSRYALVVTDAHDFSVMQKGASSLPTYSDADIAGSYTGRVATIDSSFGFVGELGSDVAINADGTFFGTDADGTTFQEDFVAISIDAPAWGFYLGTFVDSNSDSGDFAALMSPDKRFLAVYACPFGFDPDFDPPSVCSFRIYRK